MLNLCNNTRSFLRDESGQDLIEYALLAALIVAVGATVIPAIGTKVASTFTAVKTALGA